MANAHVIFHIDMNCFFASCEIVEHPELAGKPIVIAHESIDQKGLIVSPSYEARAYGIKATMVVWEAKRLCPDVIVVNPHYDLYQDYSRKFFDYFYKITKLVEPASIDEGYLDVTGVCEPTEYVNLAHRIQDDIYSLYGLPCSIGIGPNKFLAKMASDMKKPMGITVLRKRDVQQLMWPLPINDFFGAGKKTCAQLNTVGIKTIGDFATFPNKKILYDLIGENNTESMLRHAYGEGSVDVDPNRYNDVSSVSNSHTLDRDEYNEKNIVALIKILSNSVSNRLEHDEYRAHTFTLQLKYSNFTTVSKSTSITEPTCDSYKMIHIFQGLFDEVYPGDLGVRLVGVAASKLVKGKEEFKQLSLFDELDKETQDLEVSKVVNDINKIIGSNSLKKGVK